MNQNEYIALTLPGLETVLAHEIEKIGGTSIRTDASMVYFYGDHSLLYKANIHLRTALRILKPLIHFKATNPDEAYELVRSFDWEPYITGKQTFSIDAEVRSHQFKYARLLNYKVKDAIADFLEAKNGKRPSVRLINPDIPIHVFVSDDECIVSLDSSGDSLHNRGYRVGPTDGALNEVLAAGMLLLAGWDGKTNFYDPMCGSGTLLIEAALIALNIPPGIYRKSFAFENWGDFDADLLDAIHNEEAEQRPFHFEIYGSDISPISTSTAEKNIKNASLTNHIQLKTQSIQKIQEAALPGLLVTNPPAGERLRSNDVLMLYEQLGERLKHVFTGYTAWILCSREDCFEQIGLRASDRICLFNDKLECEYRRYELFSGRPKFTDQPSKGRY